MLISYVIRKIKESKAKNANQPQDHQDQVLHTDSSNTVTKPEVHQDASTDPSKPEPSGWALWKPRVILTGAIFLPVFLETLDYTGQSSLPSSHLMDDVKITF
jgi:hypothetical protein